jgi:hypothetical protein
MTIAAEINLLTCKFYNIVFRLEFVTRLTGTGLVRFVCDCRNEPLVCRAVRIMACGADGPIRRKAQVGSLHTLAFEFVTVETYSWNILYQIPFLRGSVRLMARQTFPVCNGSVDVGHTFPVFEILVTGVAQFFPFHFEEQLSITSMRIVTLSASIFV